MAGFFDDFGPSRNAMRRQRSERDSSSSRSRSQRMDDDVRYTRSGRPSTGRNPGTVLDPEHDGRLHHGEQKVGLHGRELLSEEEWIAAHHVPHPGALGNQNARGPHNIPSRSLERIREGGRKGGEAHRGMRFRRVDNEGQPIARASRKTAMSSRASGTGMRQSRGAASAAQQQGRSSQESNMRQLDEVRSIANRLQEVLNELAG